jgi:hypothetical protein
MLEIIVAIALAALGLFIVGGIIYSEALSRRERKREERYRQDFLNAGRRK